MSDYTPTVSPDRKGWYEIPGYPGCCANRRGEILTKKTGHVTKGGNAGRYLKISAYKDGAEKPSLVYVHDLVCRAFHGPPEPGQVVLHDDDDRWNNLPNNLGWGTQQRNMQAMWDNGLRQKVSREAYITPIWEAW